MKILITGSAGFIGGHATDVAIENGHTVSTIDGLRYAADPARLRSGATHRFWDLRSPIPSWLREDLGRFDAIWHFAADSHVDRSISDPVPFIEGNVSATLNILEGCRNGLLDNGGYFVQISTDEVYGPGQGAGHEEWSPILPSNPYAASKAAQEAIAISYWRSYGIPLVITNTMNNYGPDQDPEKFIPKAITHLLADVSMPVHARVDAEGKWVSGSRCWLPVREHAFALLKLHSAIDDGRATFLGDLRYNADQESRPIRMNIAGPQLHNDEVVWAMAQALDKELPSSVEYVDFHGSRPGHDLHYALDSTRSHPIFQAPTLEEVVFDLGDMALGIRDTGALDLEVARLRG